jgi:hypothetical protein
MSYESDSEKRARKRSQKTEPGIRAKKRSKEKKPEN